MIGNYTSLGVTYSLVIGRYTLHNNQCQEIRDFNPRDEPIYNFELLNKIYAFLNLPHM